MSKKSKCVIPLDNPPKDFIFAGNGKYRMLSKGEIVRLGDEYLANGRWFASQLNGQPCYNYPYRRRVIDDDECED